MNTPDHPVLSALMIYALENGPLRLTVEQIQKYDGKYFGALQLSHDCETGEFVIYVEVVAPQLADSISHGQGGPHAMQPDDSLFGPSTLYGPLQNMPTPKKPAKRDEKVIHVVTVTLNGGPRDGVQVVVPYPLKKVIFWAGPGDRQMHPEVAYSVKGQAYGRRDGDFVPGDFIVPGDGKTPGFRYDYLGFVSMEDLNNEIRAGGGEELDPADWWRNGDDDD